MSGEDFDQCMIDLLYGYTIASNTDIWVRKKIVSEINKLMLPYIKGQCVYFRKYFQKCDICQFIFQTKMV